jgi:4-oxalocrotonate tautomerase
MPIIDVTLLDGRDDATKRRFMRELTDLAESTLQIPRHSIRVVIREVPRSHYAVGGVPKDELDVRANNERDV